MQGPKGEGDCREFFVLESLGPVTNTVSYNYSGSSLFPEWESSPQKHRSGTSSLTRDFKGVYNSIITDLTI